MLKVCLFLLGWLTGHIWVVHHWLWLRTQWLYTPIVWMPPWCHYGAEGLEDIRRITGFSPLCKTLPTTTKVSMQKTSFLYLLSGLYLCQKVLSAFGVCIFTPNNLIKKIPHKSSQQLAWFNWFQSQSRR